MAQSDLCRAGFTTTEGSPQLRRLDRGSAECHKKLGLHLALALPCFEKDGLEPSHFLAKIKLILREIGEMHEMIDKERTLSLHLR
jgi:hypothetical protein